jgi:F1F0 ATPase subunit 2
MMNETLILLMAWIAGSLIGLTFFGGLWWTVRKGLESRYAALWFTGSVLVRMSVTVTGFYFIGRDHWPRLLACLFGFVVARVVVMRLTGARLQKPSASSAEAHHAS